MKCLPTARVNYSHIGFHNNMCTGLESDVPGNKQLVIVWQWIASMSSVQVISTLSVCGPAHCD